MFICHQNRQKADDLFDPGVAPGPGAPAYVRRSRRAAARARSKASWRQQGPRPRTLGRRCGRGSCAIKVPGPPPTPPHEPSRRPGPPSNLKIQPSLFQLHPAPGSRHPPPSARHPQQLEHPTFLISSTPGARAASPGPGPRETAQPGDLFFGGGLGPLPLGIFFLQRRRWPWTAPFFPGARAASSVARAVFSWRPRRDA